MRSSILAKAAWVISLTMPLTLWAQPLQLDKDLKLLKARSIGPAGMSGRVTTIDAVHNNPEIIYIGAASGGVWKTTSGGARW